METPPPEAPRRRHWNWFKREAIDLGDVAVQVFAVVVGILLALFINDWVMQRQQQANVDEAMHAIGAELAHNRVVLRDYARHMYRMAAAMQDSPRNRNQPPRVCYLWNEWDGIGGLIPLDSAYRTSIATQALANMPFKQAQVVSQIYGHQQYILKGVELDTSLMMQQPHPVDFCAGIVDEIGRNVMQLDQEYATLIGPDSAPSPEPLPAGPASAMPPSTPSPQHQDPP